MTGKVEALKLDAARAVRRFYFDVETAANRVNENLLDGHAGTGNDGRNIANNAAFNNAIAGKKSAGGVSFLTADAFPAVKQNANNKNNIVEAITLRCA